MSVVKVSLEEAVSGEKILYDFDMSKSLEETTNDICAAFGKPCSPAYGLKLIYSNTGQSILSYITSDNIHQIKNGYSIQLVFSLNTYANRIFEHINDKYKERSFQDLYELSVDPEFIKEIVRTEKHVKLMDVFTNSELTDFEQTACLIAIVHLFQKQYIIDIKEQFLNKIVSICKNFNNNNHELIKYALSVVHKILCHRNQNFSQWKEETIKLITVDDLMHYIGKKNVPDLQYGALLVINSLIKCCKGDKRFQLIKEINQRKYRELIHSCIIVDGKVDKNTAHELYLYQTYILSLHAETLASALPETELFKCNEFEAIDNDVKKFASLMEFDDNVPINKTASIENLLELDDIRISLASVTSKQSDDSHLSNIQRNSTTEMETENIKVSFLTFGALNYYKRSHNKNFQQTQAEALIYAPGILISSERVVRMLAKILHIGRDPDRNGVCYQPIIFSSSSKTPFFFQLFSRTMWLLTKTRRDMNATTMEDFEKVINVLEKQVNLVLESKPKDFAQLTAEMLGCTYDKVRQIYTEEKEKELARMLAENPSLQVLKQKFAKVNEEIVYKQRMNYVRTGTIFPKFHDKKINGNFHAKLSSNCRELLISDYNGAAKSIVGEIVSHSLVDIMYVVEGKACPHCKNNSVKDPKLAFSIIINNNWINFKAADRKSASYWLDALNLLLGKENRSDYYKAELKELVEMDVVLHLMELQNAKIPNKAPKIPRAPFEVKPPLPPKPTKID